MISHTIQVMNLSVLPSVMMSSIFLNSSLRAIEDRWLVHIVPNVKVIRIKSPLLIFTKPLVPELTSSRSKGINPNRFTWPAVSMVRLVFRVFNSKITAFECFVGLIIFDCLDMGSIIATSFLLDSSSSPSIFSCPANAFSFHVKYFFSSVYSISNQMTSYGILFLSKLALTSSTSSLSL